MLKTIKADSYDCETGDKSNNLMFRKINEHVIGAEYHNINVYIAGSFTTPELRKELEHMLELFNKSYPCCNIFIPMEHKVEGDYQKPDGTWNLSNPEWARRVFEMDKLHLDNAHVIYAMYTGHVGTTGTSWELGYACAKGIPVILYIPDWVKNIDCSLMVLNGAKEYMDSKGISHPITDEWLSQFNQK